MQFINTEIPGVKLVQLHKHEDARGTFIKTFHKNLYDEAGASFEMRESYFSGSEPDVIRGMHFQVPPHDHEKLVYPVHGKLIDVLLDIREGSPMYGKAIGIPLDANNPSAVYIPKGIAHGFAPVEGSCTLVYATSTEYDQESDWGIRWDSFGFEWPVNDPTVSDRDAGFIGMNEFESPFLIEE